MYTSGLQEPMAQRWRALAMLKNNEEALLYVGNTIAQVRENYAEVWFDMFDEDVRDHVREVVLQKFVGAPDRGRWITQISLPTHCAEGGKLTTKGLQERNILASAECTFFEVREPQIPYDIYLDAVTRGIAENDYFHDLVTKLVSKLTGRTLVIVERIEHGDRLQERIPGALWVRGQDTIETRKEIIERLKVDQQNVVAVATAGIFNTGVNVFVNSLVNAAGGAAEHQIIQRFGRGLRRAIDKEHLQYYDFMFLINDYLLDHSKKRIKTLKKEGHVVKVYKDLDGYFDE